jgi:uncharacterized protein YndB with AHSA1/START domain
MGSAATLEAVPCGAYRVMTADRVQAADEVVEVDPPRRIVFTWGWTHDHAVAPGSNRVVVTVEEETGGTRAGLRHHDLPTTRSASITGDRVGTAPTATQHPSHRRRPRPKRVVHRQPTIRSMLKRLM